MSEDSSIDREFILDMIRLIAGLILLFVVGTLMVNFDEWRTNEIAPDLQGQYLLFLIPILVPITIFAADIAVKGAITLGTVIVRTAQPQQQ